MTQGHGLFSPSLKLKLSESNSGRVESSTSTQPEREIRPGSIGSAVFPPRAPSRVRVVPCRFSVSVMPGCQVTCLPPTLSSTERLSAANLPSPEEPSYVSINADVFNVSLLPDSSFENFGTGKWRLIKT